ncbi:MAG: phospholipid carrier-dependent glycosyltransferase, partial [Chloroflexi bacterium]|nr:phospholipid carrier-dependent glycosyltransferase [Chloroflexota bacterium]
MINAATRAPIYDSRFISREKIGVALIFILALGVRIGLRAGLEFDGLYGQDSFAYFDYAHSLADSITRTTVPPPFFWPIGYPALTAFASFFIPIEIAAQWINILCGALIATFTFLLARELTNNHRVAFIAAIIVAGAGQLFISSLAIMADASALMWTMISAYALARFNRARSPKWIAGAGIALGLAMMTRWIYALMIPVWFVALWKNKNEFAASFKNCARLILFSLLALSPQIALMLYHAPNFPLAFIGDWARTGWDITHAWQNVIVNNDGNFSYALPVAAFYALPLAQPTYIFPFLTAFVLVGAWSLRRDQFAARILIGWIVAQWIYLSGDAWENWRFALAYFPPAAILAAMGVNYFFDSLPRAAPARFARLTLLL